MFTLVPYTLYTLDGERLPPGGWSGGGAKEGTVEAFPGAARAPAAPFWAIIWGEHTIGSETLCVQGVCMGDTVRVTLVFPRALWDPSGSSLRRLSGSSGAAGGRPVSSGSGPSIRDYERRTAFFPTRRRTSAACGRSGLLNSPICVDASLVVALVVPESQLGGLDESGKAGGRAGSTALRRSGRPFPPFASWASPFSRLGFGGEL